MKTPICDFLSDYQKSGRLRLHMPGHNGEFSHDITEISGADSLYESDKSGGIICCSENLASVNYKAGKTMYSCGGSTLAIQTALAVLKSQGCKTIAAGRYSHKSLVSAAALLGLEIKWLYPDEYLSADMVIDEQAMSGVDAVFVTNIDYYGGTFSGWDKIPQNMPIVCDNAHGAYLAFVDNTLYGAEYIHPMRRDRPIISAESAHKTLPVLTGGAYLHFSKGIDCSRAKEFMGMFGSSSPSYPMMEGLDRFNNIISSDPELVNRACASVALVKNNLLKMGVPLKNSDPLRIVIDTRQWGYSGVEYAAELRNNGVECEMADDNYVVLLFSAVTTVQEAQRAELAVKFVKQRQPLEKNNYPVVKTKQQLPLAQAMFAQQKTVALENTVGEICGGIIAPCPPCVPLIMPGEEITAEAAKALAMYGVKQVSVVVR